MKKLDCPSCGAPLHTRGMIARTKTRYICEYCGNIYSGREPERVNIFNIELESPGVKTVHKIVNVPIEWYRYLTKEEIMERVKELLANDLCSFIASEMTITEIHDIENMQTRVRGSIRIVPKEFKF